MKKFKFTITGNKYEVEIKKFEDNIASIEVNGTKYKVEVDQELQVKKTPTLVRKPVINNGGAKIKKQDGVTYKVKAPLPGNILNIKINVGDTITKGDTLLVMEAMKMENNINSEKDGVVKSIKVANGDAVLQEDVLLEIEY